MTAVVSMTHLTMGKLALRRLSPEELRALADPGPSPALAHWTLRAPAGALIIDVHPHLEAFSDHVRRTTAVFQDPVHRLSIERFAFLDAEREAATLDQLSRSATPSEHGDDDGRLRGRLVAFNRLPQLAIDSEAAVWSAIAALRFGSVAQLVLASASGPLLVDAYLDESTLIDDFVARREVLADIGVGVTNEWYAFTDRAHEVALDRLAIGLGRLPP